MYLLYDVIQLRRSSLANSILIKRQHWRSTTKDISLLTVDQLLNAAKTLAAGGKIEDPRVKRLQKNLISIAKHVPGSFAQKLVMRSNIRGIIVRYGMPGFWITINPSDLRNPLVVILAGVEYSGDIFAAANAAIRHAAATSNPVAVAEFFHHVCKAVLEGLLATASEQMGVLGDVSNHFGVVETNGRGMLHLHALVWLRGNTAFTTLRDRLREDSNFADRMIRYLDSTIMHGINVSATPDVDVNPPNTPPSSKEQETDDEFLARLDQDSNVLASTKQRHSKNHMATCFKYRRRGTGKNACRFGMPRDLAPSSTVDEFGIVHQRRNDAWINPWNPAIASCIRSNHDISWIPTVSKSLSLVYYITNYATKDDISPEQMLLKAALLRQSIEKAKMAEHPTAAETRLREKGMDQFALRCFNTLANLREISGVQVANTLLQYPDSYTVGSRFFSVDLWWLRRYVRGILYPDDPNNENTSVPVDDEPCRYEAGESAPVSAFDNYKWRGSILASLSLYEYCMMVQTRNNRSARPDDIDFDSSHPRCDNFIQHLAHNPSDLTTVTFNGQLTEYQTEEDSVAGGHPKTDAIMNDLAEILLGLFVPWERLPLLFLQPATQLNPYSRLWTAVEPTLPPHIRDFARNIELLRKSKEDCKLDAVLREAAAQMADDSFDRDVDELDVQDLDLEDEDGAVRNDDIDIETLIAAYHSIRNRWHREALLSADRIPALAHGSISPPDLQLSSLLPLDVSNTSTAPRIAGLQLFPQTTLQAWESRLKHVLESEEGEENTPQGAVNPNDNVDDFNLELENGTLLPTLTSSDATTCMADRRLLVGHNPTGASLIKLVCEDIPLNFKQRLLVERVLSEALARKDHSDGESKGQQFRLLVLGKAGVGKSWIIKGIKAGMDLVDRKKEVIVMAPTGLASSKIGGSTYHTALGVPIIRRKERTTVPSRVRRLWSEKTIMMSTNWA